MDIMNQIQRRCRDSCRYELMKNKKGNGGKFYMVFFVILKFFVIVIDELVWIVTVVMMMMKDVNRARPGSTLSRNSLDRPPACFCSRCV